MAGTRLSGEPCFASPLIKDLIIIGGGIGGLTLALAVHGAKAGQRIRIFEAAPDLHALGVGINLGPHAVKELSALGLQEHSLLRDAHRRTMLFSRATASSSIASLGALLRATNGRTSRFIAATCISAARCRARTDRSREFHHGPSLQRGRAGRGRCHREFHMPGWCGFGI